MLNCDLIPLAECSTAAAVMDRARAVKARRDVAHIPKPPPPAVKELRRPPKWVEPVTPEQLRQRDAERARRRAMGEGYKPTLQRIERLVLRNMGVDRNDFYSSRRYKRTAMARMLFCMMARKYTNKSFPAIGAYLGRDHTTVLHACRNWEERKAHYRQRSDLAKYKEKRRAKGLKAEARDK